MNFMQMPERASGPKMIGVFACLDKLWPRRAAVDMSSKFASVDNNLITVKHVTVLENHHNFITSYDDNVTSVTKLEASTTFYVWNFRIA
jgi:hypothetical protein